MEATNELLATGIGTGIVILIVIIGLLDGVLKIIGMWKSARRSQMTWFVVLAIFNTAGILPIIYLLTGAKKPETLEKVSI